VDVLVAVAGQLKSKVIRDDEEDIGFLLRKRRHHRGAQGEERGDQGWFHWYDVGVWVNGNASGK
jgi:hypothetical protein